MATQSSSRNSKNEIGEFEGKIEVEKLENGYLILVHYENVIKKHQRGTINGLFKFIQQTFNDFVIVSEDSELSDVMFPLQKYEQKKKKAEAQNGK